MVTAFLIATLIIFSMNLMLNILLVGFNLNSENPVPPISVINIIVNLIMITWNIVAIVSV